MKNVNFPDAVAYFGRLNIEQCGVIIGESRCYGTDAEKELGVAERDPTVSGGVRQSVNCGRLVPTLD